MALKFLCLNCQNTKQFWVVWGGEVAILHDRHIDASDSDYPIDFGNPDDNESARLILCTPTFSVDPEAVLRDVVCASCNCPAQHIRWISRGKKKPVPLGETSSGFYPFTHDN